MLESAAARRHFVDYFHHHTEIHFAVRAGRAAEAVLDRLAASTRPARAWPGQAAVGLAAEAPLAGGVDRGWRAFARDGFRGGRGSGWRIGPRPAA